MTLARLAGAIRYNPRALVQVVSRTAPLVGYRARYPGGNTIRQDFDKARPRFGEAQVTKDFVTKLSTKYTPSFPSSTLVIVSISRAVDFDTDPNFDAFIRSLPTNVILTWQHEPERAGANFPWTGAQYVALLNRFRDKVRAIRTDIPVWLISSGYSYRNGGPATDGSFFKGLHVDGYGLDTYRNGQANDTGTAYLKGGAPIRLRDRPEFTKWFSFVPSGKPWGITEYGIGWVDTVIDTSVKNPKTGKPYPGTMSTIAADRIPCLRDSLTDIQDLGGLCLLFFLSAEGPDGGNWFPNDDPFAAAFTALPRSTSNPLLPT